MARSVENVKKRVVTNRRIVAAVLIGSSVLLITFLHYVTKSGNRPLHSVYTEFHYIPLLLAGLVFGLRGALLTSLMVALLDGVYTAIDWRGASLWLLDDSVHVILPVIFSLLIGFLVDLRNSNRRQLEQKTYLSGLGQASAVLVHDLKNPLLNVEAAMMRLEKGTSPPEQAMAAVNVAVERMKQIMDGALDFSKPLQLNRREEDAASLVKELLCTCSAKAEQEGVELKAEVTEQPVMVEVDSALIHRALVNLVNNAIEASRRGQSVSIRLRAKNDRAIIKVRDYGRGMDERTLKNLFIPFYSKKSNGTGLGTAVARKIVEEHGGRITVKSRLANGTKISVQLPSACLVKRTACL